VNTDPEGANLFEEDTEAILAMVQSGTLGTGSTTKLIGIERLQKSIDVLTERLDFNVPNNIPVPIALSETLRNGVVRRQEFISNDYDRAVIDKILMVLVNSESQTKSRLGAPAIEECADEDQDANMQKEQVSEEEVLKEQVRATYLIATPFAPFSGSEKSVCCRLRIGGRRRGRRRRGRRGGGRRGRERKR
jgi:hypothetical protein